MDAKNSYVYELVYGTRRTINAVHNFMKLFRNIDFKVKRMKVNQLWAPIGFEEQTIEMDFVGINDVRIR